MWMERSFRGVREEVLGQLWQEGTLGRSVFVSRFWNARDGQRTAFALRGVLPQLGAIEADVSLGT